MLKKCSQCGKPFKVSEALAHKEDTCEECLKKIMCEHLNIEYGTLEQEDGEPFYNVTCQDCDKKGRIMLIEAENIF